MNLEIQRRKMHREPSDENGNGGQSLQQSLGGSGWLDIVSDYAESVLSSYVRSAVDKEALESVWHML